MVCIPRLPRNNGGLGYIHVGALGLLRLLPSDPERLGAKARAV